MLLRRASDDVTGAVSRALRDGIAMVRRAVPGNDADRSVSATVM
jgi:hypothetical protein